MFIYFTVKIQAYYKFPSGTYVYIDEHEIACKNRTLK